MFHRDEVYKLDLKPEPQKQHPGHYALQINLNLQAFI